MKYMTTKNKIARYCGSICDNCKFFKGVKEPKCLGCLSCAGKPFWGKCNVAECAINKKIEHCGLCADFPCELLPKQFDPNNPRGKEEAIFRIGHLAIRAKIGTEQWLEKLANGYLVSFISED